MLDFTAGGVGHENQPRPLETYRDGLFRREQQSSGAGKPRGKVQDRFLVAESPKNDSKIPQISPKSGVWGALHEVKGSYT